MYEAAMQGMRRHLVMEARQRPCPDMVRSPAAVRRIKRANHDPAFRRHLQVNSCGRPSSPSHGPRRTLPRNPWPAFPLDNLVGVCAPPCGEGEPA